VALTTRVPIGHPAPARRGNGDVDEVTADRAGEGSRCVGGHPDLPANGSGCPTAATTEGGRHLGIVFDEFSHESGVWCDSHRLLSPRVMGHAAVRTR
jgi:hypothetical protein